MRRPAPTIRRRVVAALIAVALGVAVPLGIAGYESSEQLLEAEIDRSLASAASTLSAGGTVAAVIAQTQSDRRAGGGRGEGDTSDQQGIVQSAQTVTPAGVVTVLVGVALPVDAGSTALADRPAGTQHLDTAGVDGTDYRVLAVALGDGQGIIQVARDLTVTEAVLTELAWTTVVITAAVLLVAAAIGWWTARQLTRRLTALTVAAEQIGVTGTLDLGVEPRGRDEVSRLGDAMQGMLGDLARSRDAQHLLVQDAGHELRTPLTSLRTNISVLSRFDELSPTSRTRLLDDVQSEARELTDLINELVELATDRRDTEEPEDVDLAATADRLASTYRRRSGRVIDVTAARPLVVRVHRSSVERAMSNLLDNAVKFDPDGTAPIELILAHRADHVRISVADRGPGIDIADTARVFDRFYRATTARSRPGSGLGLAIVADVAAAHGGTVSAEARPDGGAEIAFTVRAGVPR